MKRLFIMNIFIIMSIALASNVYAQRITEAYQDYDMEDGREGSFGSWVFAIIFCISIGAILNNDSRGWIGFIPCVLYIVYLILRS